jgi:corrinoid protein of di/trimethylamine methyltransferase
MALLKELYEAVLKGDAPGAVAITRAALAGGADAEQLIADSMVPAMDEVGRRFEAQDYFIPDVLLSARAMKNAMELLRPLLAASGAKPAGRVVIGAVKGDLHDIGKNLVAFMLQGGGFEIIDLGTDVAPARFVEAVQSHRADVVCLSCLLTSTMPTMKATIDALAEAGLRSQVKVLVGGAPVTQEFAERIGADGYGETAAAAVNLARKSLGLS